LGGAFDKNHLMMIDASDIPYLADTYEPTLAEFATSRWEGECPKCGKAAKAGVRFLGQKVVCKCGVRYYFPWWNLVLDSVSDTPKGLFLPSRQADKVGVLEGESASGHTS